MDIRFGVWMCERMHIHGYGVEYSKHTHAHFIYVLLPLFIFIFLFLVELSHTIAHRTFTASIRRYKIKRDELARTFDSTQYVRAMCVCVFEQ